MLLLPKSLSQNKRGARSLEGSSTKQMPALRAGTRIQNTTNIDFSQTMAQSRILQRALCDQSNQIILLVLQPVERLPERAKFDQLTKVELLRVVLRYEVGQSAPVRCASP